MQFYTIENIKDGDKISSKGIDIMSMSKAFKVLDKKSENKDVESISAFDFVFLETPYDFGNPENLVFCHSAKSLKFALIKADVIFEIKDKKDIFYVALHEGVLNINSDKSALEEVMKTKSLNPTNEVEAKALHWLDHGRVGASSATMCGVLFPNLRSHHKLVDKIDYDDNFEIDWPLDNDDFGRCMKFLEAVPEARARLGELAKVGKEWEGLVKNWDTIETLVKEDKRTDAYNLIKESIGSKHRAKP